MFQFRIPSTPPSQKGLHMKLAQRISVTAAAAAAFAAAFIGASASSPDSASPASATVAGSQPGYAVEDFTYPGADKIKEEKGIILKRGDGHIVLADCSSGTGLMEVLSRDVDKICFRATGTSGYLTVEIPSVFSVKGAAAHTTDVTITAPDSTPQEVEVAQGAWTPVGESTDPQGDEYVLVEIRTSK